jgi:hypothetical protein
VEIFNRSFSFYCFLMKHGEYPSGIMGILKRKLLQTFQKMKMPASMGSSLFEMLYELLCSVRAPLNTIQNSLEIFSVHIV